MDFGIQFLMKMGWQCDASMYLDAECFSVCIDIINVFCNGQTFQSDIFVLENPCTEW